MKMTGLGPMIQNLFTNTKPNPSPLGWSTRDGVFLAILVSMVILCWLPRLNGPIDLRWDSGVYYVLGTSMAEGNGYRLLNEPGKIQATQYPPLFPAIVAVHQWILGTNDPISVGSALRLTAFLFYLIYIVLIFYFTRCHMPSLFAFGATLVSLLSFFGTFMSDLNSPEIMYGLTTVAFVLFAQQGNRGWYPFIAGLFGVAAFALRSIGIVLLAAWVVDGILNKDYKKVAIRFMLLLVVFLSWQSYIYSIESGNSYSNPVYSYQRADYLFYNVSYSKNMWLKDPFQPELGQVSVQDLMSRAVQNCFLLPMKLGESVSMLRPYWVQHWQLLNKKLHLKLPNWPAYLAPIILGCLVVSGMGLLLITGPRIIPLYLGIYLGSMCLTPWPGQFGRYLAPLIPFLALSLFKLLIAVREYAPKVLGAKSKGSGLVAVLSIVVLVIFCQALAIMVLYGKRHQEVVYEGPNGQKVDYRLFFYFDSYKFLDAGLDWLKKRARPDDVVAANMPHWVYLRTGLRAVMPPFEKSPSRVQELLDSVPVRYILIENTKKGSNFTTMYASTVVKGSPDKWKMVYSTPGSTFEIYQRVDI